MTQLKAPHGSLAYFLDLHPDLGDFKSDALEGLARPQKSISPMYFYDEYGSQLFNKITELEEYYPTQTEKDLFLTNAAKIVAEIKPGAAIFEYGAGSSEKIEWLANGIKASLYVAMDISKDHLLSNVTSLANALPCPVAAICADFHAQVQLPDGHAPNGTPWLGYFPGSTLGNMEPDAAVRFLTLASETLGPDAQFLIGIDLEKDIAVLEAAYDDASGVTGAFNLNLLQRFKTELGATLTLDDFEHYAFYNETLFRIEMHLRAKRETRISIDGQHFLFKQGETLHTENSHKYSLARLETLISSTPWHLTKAWTDDKDWYAACLLSNS